MRQRAMWLSSVGVGVATAYLLDRSDGKRRRRRLGDAVVHLTSQTSKGAGTIRRDLRNRTRGIVAGVRRTVRANRPDHIVLQKRVRASIGRVASRPRAIKVQAHDGHVILGGPVLAAEEHRLIRAVQAVEGVKDVDPRFERHRQAGQVPSLQGGRSHRQGTAGLDRHRNWAPATRTVVGTSGAALVAAGLCRRNGMGVGIAVAGAALVARALTNLDFRRLIGMGAGRRAIDVQKTVTIDVPIEKVFAFWDDFENFPRFMHHVREICPTRDPQVWHWTVSDEFTATPVEFNAVVTERVFNHVLSWKTTPDSVVGHAGLVRFDPVNGDRTRIQIRLWYNPPGGGLAHGVLALFGADPKSRLDEDLVRMKTALETGRRSYDASRA
jgi:uncharacterized membrane protein